jgi:hypothetical protein
MKHLATKRALPLLATSQAIQTAKNSINRGAYYVNYTEKKTSMAMTDEVLNSTP